MSSKQVVMMSSKQVVIMSSEQVVMDKIKKKESVRKSLEGGWFI